MTAELEGRTPVEVITGLNADLNNTNISTENWKNRNFFNPGGGTSWQIPENIDVVWDGEGEWDTYHSGIQRHGLGFRFCTDWYFLGDETANWFNSLVINYYVIHSYDCDRYYARLLAIKSVW